MKNFGLCLIGIALLQTSCAFHRGNVGNLSAREDKYYADLQTLLQDQSDQFKTGLTTELEVSRARQRELLEWQRDLAKIDVLLRVGAESKGGQRALLTEAAASDLSSLDQVLALENIDMAQLDALLKLYQAIIKAAAAVQKNNEAITKYLQSNDAEFAIKSLDTAALAYSITDLRDLRDQLKGAQARSAAAKTAEAEKLQKNIENVQNALLEGLKATEKK
jgi:hypothetical protein